MSAEQKLSRERLSEQEGERQRGWERQALFCPRAANPWVQC